MISISSLAPTVSPSTNQFSGRLLDNQERDDQGNKKVDSEKLDTDAFTQLPEQKQLQSLKTRDREVRAHELAHASVGGQFASGASYTYQKGSDGVLYAIAGEVSISSSTVVGDPKATLEKAKTIQRAALAPANPSSQDRYVAANAAAMAQKARLDIMQMLEIENSLIQNQEKETSIDVFA